MTQDQIEEKKHKLTEDLLPLLQLQCNSVSLSAYAVIYGEKKKKKNNKNHTHKNQTPQHKNMAGGEISRSQNWNINWTYHRTKHQENQQRYKITKLKHRNTEET